MRRHVTRREHKERDFESYNNKPLNESDKDHTKDLLKFIDVVLQGA